MKTFLTAVVVIIKIIGYWLDGAIDRREIKKQGVADVLNGINNQNPSLITRGFDRINRVRK